jgi:hypothetical protein
MKVLPTNSSYKDKDLTREKNTKLSCVFLGFILKINKKAIEERLRVLSSALEYLGGNQWNTGPTL